jgi:type IV pilus assembly protein PilN
MIKINLLPEARVERVQRAPMITMGLADINNYLLVGCLLVGMGVVGVTYWRLSSRLGTVRDEVAVNRAEYERLKPIIDEVEDYKKRNADLKHRIEVIERLKNNQYGPVRIMDEVSKAVPDLLWLDSMTLSGNTVTVKGKAFNETAVANLIANLAASAFFAEPSLRIMSQDQQGVFSFDLSCGFTYTPPQALAEPAPQG